MALIVRRNRDEWDLFRDVSEVQREMNRLFSFFPALVSRGNGETGFEGAWTMPLDVYETKDSVVVKAELPGLKPEEIDVSVLGNTLTIKAERKHEAEVTDEQFHRRELAYGLFQRQLELPQAVNAEALQAVYKNGILELTLPRKEEAKPKQVKVQAQ